MKISQITKSQLSSKEKAFIHNELKMVSRSFYLTLKVLPREIFTPAGIAYLIARYIDDIVDNESLPINSKTSHLYEIRKSFTNTLSNNDLSKSLHCNIKGCCSKITSYKKVFDNLSSENQHIVSKVLLHITDGMSFELEKLVPHSPNEVNFLNTYSELDTYIYKIAGSVGEFFSNLILLHEKKLELSDTDYFFELSSDFGKALQLTNIIRDFGSDLIEGKCYIPKSSLEHLNFDSYKLLNHHENQIGLALSELLPLATKYYVRAATYIMLIPKSLPRLRLAALWPFLIGVETLNKLASNKNQHDLKTPIKVKRKWIYIMITKSLFLIHNDKTLKFILDRQIQKLYYRVSNL